MIHCRPSTTGESPAGYISRSNCPILAALASRFWVIILDFLDFFGFFFGFFLDFLLPLCSFGVYLFVCFLYLLGAGFLYFYLLSFRLFSIQETYLSPPTLLNGVMTLDRRRDHHAIPAENGPKSTRCKCC